jgi:hypothetical protein
MIMKKMMLTLAITISSLATFAAGEEKVNQKVLDAFKNDFAVAKNVEWISGDNYYRAAFVYNDQHVFAYYSTEGDLLGLTRYISLIDLPMNLQISLKKELGNYWITDLFEVAKNGTTTYYITLENADEKNMYKSSNACCWEEFKTIKKI